MQLGVRATLAGYAMPYEPARARRAHLHPTLSWPDIAAVVLAGLGFTVSLLVGSLAFGAGGHDDDVKIAVLLAAAVVAVTAPSILRHRKAGCRTEDMG